MTSAEFVRRIRVAVYEASVEDVLSILDRPPGRHPLSSLTELSGWYNWLSIPDKERVRDVVRLAARTAVFEMLTVLDGVTSIRETGEDAGSLELRYRSGGQSVLLNRPAGELLHDLFAQQDE
jgi:hypothetical protein